MIPRLVLRVLWGVEDIAILWICFSESRFNDCCLRWHSIIKPPDFNLVTFFTSPAQLLMHFSITKGDNLVSGIQPSLLSKTIKRDQLLENSISSSYLLSFFLFLFGICWFKHKESEAAMLPCIIVHHPCPHPPRSGNTGDTSIPRISVGKCQEFQGWYTRTVEFILWTQASYQGWFPNETTVRNINYSFDPLT